MGGWAMGGRGLQASAGEAAQVSLGRSATRLRLPAHLMVATMV